MDRRQTDKTFLGRDIKENFENVIDHKTINTARKFKSSHADDSAT